MDIVKTRSDYKPQAKPEFQAKFDYIFDLEPGENLFIGDEVMLGYVGLNNNTRQARFRIKAPTEISILRLEVFARHMQSYEYIIDLYYGQKLKIGENIELLVIPDKHGRKLVHLGIDTPRETEVKKSIKNNTA